MDLCSYVLGNFKDSFKPKKIQSLDGIRTISCLFVIIGHFSYIYSPYLINLLGPVWGATITFTLGNQYTGVTFFFVLSGFLITNILIEEISLNKKINFYSFFIKRALRIFPAYYFYLSIILIYLYAYYPNSFTGNDVLAAITYTYNYLSDKNPWQMGHFWSLAIEEHFYLIWPLLFSLSYKKYGIKIPILIILLSPLIRVICYYLFPEIRGRLTIMSHARFDSILFGCALAYIYKMNYFISLNQYIKEYKLTPISLFHILFLSRLLQQMFTGSYTMTIGYTLDGLAMCIVLIHAVQNQNKFTEFLNKPLMIHLGTLSYSLYLWHVPFTYSNLGTNNLFIRIFGIYVCALFSYLLIESPFLLFRKKILN